MHTGAQKALKPPISEAPFGTLPRRFGALVIDNLLSLGVVGMSTWLLRAFEWWHPPEVDPIYLWRGMNTSSKMLVLLCYALACGVIYLSLFESSRWQASIGKRLMGIYVTDNQQVRIGTGRAFARSLIKVFHNLIPQFVPVASGVMVVVTAKHKALHDYAAGTLVLRGRVPARIEGWRLGAALVGQVVLDLAICLVMIHLVEGVLLAG